METKSLYRIEYAKPFEEQTYASRLGAFKLDSKLDLKFLQENYDFPKIWFKIFRTKGALN